MYMEVKTNLYNALYYHNASVFFYRGVMIILLLLILGCSDSNKVAKDTVLFSKKKVLIKNNKFYF